MYSYVGRGKLIPLLLLPLTPLAKILEETDLKESILTEPFPA